MTSGQVKEVESKVEEKGEDIKAKEIIRIIKMGISLKERVLEVRVTGKAKQING